MVLLNSTCLQAFCLLFFEKNKQCSKASYTPKRVLNGRIKRSGFLHIVHPKMPFSFL